MAENRTDRSRKMWSRARPAKSAAAAFVPLGLGSTKIVVLGQENFFTCVFAVFNVIRQVFGGVF